jgi:hypothetical protein
VGVRYLHVITAVRRGHRRRPNVLHLLRDLSTDTLLRVVAGLEMRIIDGVANDDDITTYVQAQWEIADRAPGIDGRADGAPTPTGSDEARL